VGVPRQLEIDPGRRGTRDGARVMSEQDHRQCRVTSGQRGGHVFAGAGIVDACELERLVDRDVLVAQDPDAERAQMLEPHIRIPVVLVVAGDGVDTVARLESAQGLDVMAELVQSAIDEIAGDDDQVRRECVDGRDDLGKESFAEDRTDVNVRELGNRVAGRARRQLREGHTHVAHDRAARHVHHAVDHGHDRRADTGDRRRAWIDTCHRADQMGERCGNEQIHRESKPRVGEPDERLRGRTRQSPQEERRDRQARRQHDDGDRRQHVPRRR